MAVSLVRPGTTSGHVFDKNLGRTSVLIGFYDRDQERERPNRAGVQLLRSALVFTVGALDAYLHDVILELAPKSTPLSPTMRDGLTSIAKENPSLALRVALAPSEEARRSEFREALGEWLQTQTFHGPKRVQKALDYLACHISWNEFDQATGVQNTASYLDKITQQRHALVHRGEQLPLTRSQTQTAFDLVGDIVTFMDYRLCILYGLRPAFRGLQKYGTRPKAP